ncbi:MFS transporter [Halalkalibaculum sp. DA384]|uniref:MFS transporter n=1 Tax=Halalkalibaculum sp. DA384 TaxID=3373606 RepID=UPI003753F243
MKNARITTEKHVSLLKDKNLYVIFGVTLSAVMGVASIAPALPKMGRVLEVSNQQIGLLITMFTLPGIFLTPVFGVLADRIGRKAVLIPSLFLFGISGTACAYATDFSWLLILRFLQGIGGASLGALNITLIGDLYSGNQRATAMGYNSSVLSIGTAAYPAIGGALATLGWFFPFYLSLLAIPTGLFVLMVLQNPEPSNGTTLTEYLKNVAGSIQSTKVIGLFTANFLTFVMLYGGYLTFFPILMDERFGKSSFVIGIILSGSSFVTALTSSQLGKLTARFSEPNLILTAAVIYISVFLIIPFTGNIWMLLIPIALFGVAQGINIPSVLTLLTHQAPTEHRAAFLSVNWTVIRGGQALGPVLLGTIYGFWDITGTFLFTAGLALLFVVISLLMIK